MKGKSMEMVKQQKRPHSCRLHDADSRANILGKETKGRGDHPQLGINSSRTLLDKTTQRG